MDKSKESSTANEGRRELERIQADLSMTQGRLDRSEVEKMELVRLLERKQVEMDSLNDQLESLIRKQSQLRQEGNGKDLALEELRRTLTSIQVELGVTRQESEQTRKQLEWTQAELEKTINEFKDYRRQKVLLLKYTWVFIALDIS